MPLSNSRVQVMTTETNRTAWLILAKGRTVRHWRARTVAGLCVLALSSTAIGGAAVGFGMSEPAVELLVPDTSERDALIDAYERRISAMKRQIDTITNQQLTERRAMEAQIATLLERQRELTERQGKLGNVIQRAAGADKRIIVPSPRSKPDVRADASNTRRATKGRLEPTPKLTTNTLAAFVPIDTNRPPTPHEVFKSLDKSLASLDQTQRNSVQTLATEANDKADTILRELASIGVASPKATGGPFVALNQPFDASIDALDDALDKLEAAKRAAIRAPIGHPLKGQKITSRFGPRKDPFNRRRAMHNGIDFRAGYGHPVRASGGGVVVKAGTNGGYGRMVVIDHGNGVTTRYAHLKRIDVRVGQSIDMGTPIGTVGSTGRSTGPHLHYEVRKNGKPIDPLHFIRTGQSVARYL